MNILKVLELFGGIGAPRKALERLNIDFKTVDYVDIDKYAVKSYNAIFNENFIPQDIQEWDKDIEVDFIIHGSPCQDFSSAGKGAGGDLGSGTRSSLMYETLRIVEKLKPKYVLWENVKGVLQNKHKHNFENYLSKMEQMGYTNYYKILNSKDYNIPQSRERVFTISILGEHKPFVFPEKKELTRTLNTILDDEVDPKYYLSKEKIQSILNWKAFERPLEHVRGKNSITNTLRSKFNGSGGMILYSDKLYNTTNIEKIIKPLVLNYKNGNTRTSRENRVYDTKGIYPTVTTSRNPIIFENHSSYLDDLKIRKITPLEAWRLMDFDDIDFIKAKESGVSDTQLCKQAGNSIVVNVLYEIFNQLFRR